MTDKRFLLICLFQLFLRGLPWLILLCRCNNSSISLWLLLALLFLLRRLLLLLTSTAISICVISINSIVCDLHRCSSRLEHLCSWVDLCGAGCDSVWWNHDELLLLELHLFLFEFLFYFFFANYSLKLAVSLVAEAAELVNLLFTCEVALSDIVCDSQTENGVATQRIAQSVNTHYRLRVYPAYGREGYWRRGRRYLNFVLLLLHSWWLR